MICQCDRGTSIEPSEVRETCMRINLNQNLPWYLTFQTQVLLDLVMSQLVIPPAIPNALYTRHVL
jgi:hypothetical protein